MTISPSSIKEKCPLVAELLGFVVITTGVGGDFASNV